MPKFRNGLAKVGRVYHFHFQQGGRTYHGSTGCEHRSAAELVLQKRREDLALARAGVLVLKKDVPTLAKALEKWCAAQKGAATEDHIGNVRTALQLHLKPLLALPLDQIDNQVVEDARTAYLNSTGTGHRPGQNGEWSLSHTLGGANKVVQHLGSVVGWAVRRREGGLDRMPYKVRPLKPEPAIKPILWPEQVQTFLQETQAHGRRYAGEAFAHTHVACCLMLGLGLREGEAVGLEWEQVDQRRRVVQVFGHDRELREIPVPAWIMDLLARHLGPTTAAAAGAILPGHGPGFTAKAIERAAAKAGAPGLHPHRLRASFATTHFEAGTPLSQIQQMMGHSDPETTMGYIVQRPRDQAESQERVAELMGFKPAISPKPDSIVIPSPKTPKKSPKNKAKS